MDGEQEVEAGAAQEERAEGSVGAERSNTL